MLPGMVPANDNQKSPMREMIELALLLRPLWLPGLVFSLLASGWLVCVVV
jgi:hypothetical protein